MFGQKRVVIVIALLAMGGQKARVDGQAAVITAAVLANPEAFANAAKTTVEAMGGMIDNVDKAIGAIERARGVITSTVSGHAYIINLSEKEYTWYTYNDASPFKFTTQFQSYMGAYATVDVHTLGWGAMAVFKDNKAPQYTVQRNNVYLFDGNNLSHFFSTASQ